MNHDILADKFYKAMGNRIPIEARESWADFIRNKKTTFTFRYEWIKDPRFFRWVYEHSGSGRPLDISDGAEWFGVYIHEQNNVCSQR